MRNERRRAHVWHDRHGSVADDDVVAREAPVANSERCRSLNVLELGLRHGTSTPSSLSGADGIASSRRSMRCRRLRNS